MVEIVDFWSWFKINRNLLTSDKYPSGKFNELNNIINGLGLYWEVGPGVNKENMLIISVDGEKKLIDKAKNFLSYAPILDEWEIELFKKPKINWDILEIHKDSIKISAKNWQYVLLKYNDGKKEILIKADNLFEYEEDNRYVIVHIILTNLLGEEKLMNEIDYIDILEIDDSSYKTQNLCDLNGHLDYLKSIAL